MSAVCNCRPIAQSMVQWWVGVAVVSEWHQPSWTHTEWSVCAVLDMVVTRDWLKEMRLVMSDSSVRLSSLTSRGQQCHQQTVCFSADCTATWPPAQFLLAWGQYNCLKGFLGSNPHCFSTTEQIVRDSGTRNVVSWQKERRVTIQTLQLPYKQCRSASVWFQDTVLQWSSLPLRTDFVANKVQYKHQQDRLSKSR